MTKLRTHHRESEVGRVLQAIACSVLLLRRPLVSGLIIESNKFSTGIRAKLDSSGNVFIAKRVSVPPASTVKSRSLLA